MCAWREPCDPTAWCVTSSVFAVHENISNGEIKELEGLFRHIYRFDTRANRLNVAKGHMTLVEVRKASKGIGWMEAESDLPMATRRRRSIR